MRIVTNIPDDEIKRLEHLAASESVSRAEIIRRAVAAYHPPIKTRPQDALHKVFGMWKDRGIDGLEYERAIRAEWDEREADIEKAYRTIRTAPNDSPV